MKNVALSAFLVAAFAALASQPAAAQQLYRIVGPDGKVTFSDKPPPPSSNAKVTTGRASAGSEATSLAGMPFELRGIAQRFPVTLYTRKECGPCDSGRNLLRQRGVPFAERTVESVEDAESLKRVSGQTTLPLVTIGAQQLKGFSDSEWTQYLDAAGYPKTSQLPPNYRNPPPSPMVARAAPAPAPAAAAPAPAQAAPAPATQADNPAGIRF